MSALAARDAAPARLRPAGETERIRHLDVAPSRSQKKARPRAFYALVTIAGLFAILVAQLLLSILVSDGAYQITALQQEQKELSRDQQVLTEELQVLESPQHLAENAVQLGMVASAGTAYLRLSDGAILGKAVPASASSGMRHATGGGPLIPNQLLDSVAMTPASATAATDGAGAVGTGAEGTGAPGTGQSTGSVASTDGGLPSPNTR
jgi:hypothetical protein